MFLPSRAILGKSDQSLYIHNHHSVGCNILADGNTHLAACRMWEISEILHRAELSQSERGQTRCGVGALVGKTVQGEQIAHPERDTLHMVL